MRRRLRPDALLTLQRPARMRHLPLLLRALLLPRAGATLSALRTAAAVGQWAIVPQWATELHHFLAAKRLRQTSTHPCGRAPLAR